MKQQLQVLIVESDDQVITFLKRVLEKILRSVNISVARDEATAVSHCTEVDLAIVEIGHPLFLKTEDSSELRGLDIVRHLRTEQPQLTIIAVSSYGDNAQEVARSAGADLFINNVYDSWRLEAIIKGINF